jgi:parallel beta-helix repeat protein
MLVLVFLTASCIIVPLPVKADSKTIVVPDDYSTIEVAIANANNGDTVFVREGTYEGPVNQTIVIDKSLSIVGENVESTIINLHPVWSSWWILTAEFFDYSDAITITADSCRLLNLTLIIANPGGYIYATGNALQTADNNITTGPTTGIKLKGSYCKITDNVMDGFVQITGTFNEVTRKSLYSISTEGPFNLFKDNNCQCIWVYNSNSNVFLGNKLSTDSRAYSGFDVTFSNNNFFYKNRISGFSSGVRFWFSSENTIKANTVADSLTAAINLGASSNNIICLNNFVDNPSWTRGYVYDQYSDPNYREAYPNMTASTNFWDNGSLGNYWGDYNGADANGDGVGDLPYNITGVIYNRDQNNSDFVYRQDNFPLTTRVDIDSVPIELPEWVSNLPPDSKPIYPQITEPTSQEPDSALPSPAPSPKPHESEPTGPFSLVPVVAASLASVAVIGLVLLLYFKKRHAKSGG